METECHQQRRASCEETSDVLMAATLITDAVANRNTQFRTGDKRIRSYVVYNHVIFKVVVYACLWINLLLALCEEPAVSNLALSYWITMPIEGACVLFFTARLLHGSHFQDSVRFWRDPKNLTVLITAVLTVTDMISYSVMTNVSTSIRAIRWSRPLRPLFVINLPEGRQLRKAVRNIRRTLPDILHVMILFFINVALFALLCMKLFQKRGLTYPNGRPYFQSYWDSFWDLYVLVTTANNPDVKMPAYDASIWYMTVFVVYTLINLYIIMNIVLAVIYNNYKKHLKDEVRATIQRKHSYLEAAFDLIKENHRNKDVITKDTFYNVITKVDGKKNETQVDLLFKVLNTAPEDYIEKHDFLNIADLLLIKLHVEKDGTDLFERSCPACYWSRFSQFVKQAVCSRYFRWFFDFLILMNAVCIGLNIDQAEWYFLPAFTFEIVVQLYARGPERYFRDLWNILDFSVILAALIATSVFGLIKEEATRLEILDVIMFLRILRLVRLVSISNRFKVVLTTIVSIGPSILTYGCVIFLIFYSYAIVGMELFQNLVHHCGGGGGGDRTTNESQCHCGNPALNGSKFVENGYCSNNFNDFIRSMLVLSDLLIVNQWHVIAEGYALITNKAARLYFISFHIVNVTVLLNIFTAFVLEAFILEYSSSKTHLEGVIERRIKELGLGAGQSSVRHSRQDTLELVENIEVQESSYTTNTSDGTSATEDKSKHVMKDGSLRFSLKTSGFRRLEALLQMMFENEFLEDEMRRRRQTTETLQLNTDDYLRY